jgi:hypothetical protein
MHPSTDPTTMRRREAEFAKAESAFEVARLQVKWQREDAAALDAAGWRAREVAELHQRVAALERLLGPGGKRLVGGLAKATGDALRRIRTEDREHILGEVAKAGYLSHRGVWASDQAYPAGAVVTDHGSVWCAVVRCEPGERPARAPAWRLMAKGEGKMPGVA